MEEVYYKPLLCPTGVILPESSYPPSGYSPEFVTLSAFFNDYKVDFEASQVIIAISIAVKTISATLKKKAISGMQFLGFLSNTDEPINVDISNEIMLQSVKDTTFVYQVGCPIYPKPVTFTEYQNAELIVNFTAQDGPASQFGTATYSSAFSILKRNPDPGIKDHTLQPGINILYSGYAMYGCATVFYLSIAKNRVDGFLLDPLIGELVLLDENIKIPDSGSLYTINEGISFYYKQRVLDWLEAKKNQSTMNATGSYIVSKIADIHRILKRGGIYCHPESKYMGNIYPHRLVYECQPMAHLITQAGGLATNGKTWLLDILPSHLHCSSAMYVGSKDEVVLLLRYLNPKFLKNENEESKNTS